MMAVLAVVCAACNPDVELCSSDHPHRARIQFELLNEDSEPMVIFLERSRHHMFVYGSWNAATKSFVPNPKAQIDPIYYTDGNLYAPTGEWRMVAAPEKYVKGSLSFKHESLQNVLDNMKLPDTESGKSYLEIHEGRFRYWHDRNAYSTYYDDLGDTPILVGNAAFNVAEYAKSDDVINVTIGMEPVTQKVNVNIPISKEAGIEIDSITAEMSGICKCVWASTREVDVSKTYKVIFPIGKENIDETIEPAMARGTFYATGIVSPQSKSLITGPGILSVMVFIHFFDNGERKTRALEASLNMSSLITDNPSILADDYGRVFQTAEELTYNIPVMMYLSRSRVTSIGDAGLEHWVDQTQIDVE